jgi:carbamoyl-phosphate synthase large subunit
MTIADKDKTQATAGLARDFVGLGFKLIATVGTRDFLAKNGVETELAFKMREQRPHIGDMVTDGQIQLVINTPRGKASKADDSYIRKTAIRYKVPYITTIAAAAAAAKGIAACQKGKPDVKPIQAYHADIT